MIWGRESIPLSIPPFLTGSVEIIPGGAYPVYRLVITGVAIVAGLLLYLLITRTRVGALIRAGSDNREIVAALGININLLYTLVFALSAMLAALAGIMMGPLLSVEPGAGDPILILTLVVVVIGGIGSVRGALVGALMVGIFDTLQPRADPARDPDQCHLRAGRHGGLRADGGGAAVQPHRPVRGASGLTMAFAPTPTASCCCCWPPQSCCRPISASTTRASRRRSRSTAWRRSASISCSATPA